MKGFENLLLWAGALALFLGAGWRPARAQEGVRFASLEVDLWPEYDRERSMLVIYRIELAPDVPRSGQITLRLPAEVGTPNAVAEAQTATDTLFNVQYSSRQDDNWVYVTFSPTMPHVRLEYYDPRLTIDGDRRSFAYQWPGDYPVDSLVVEVQQPRAATRMEITPSLGEPQENPNDGLVYYMASFAGLEAGEAFTLQVAYRKSDDSLSVSNVPVVAEPPQAASTTPTSAADILPWALGGIGVLLILAGAVWYWRTSRMDAVEQPRKRRRRSAGKKKTPERKSGGVPPGVQVYCHQCGKRADPGDRFCRSCGTRLRLPSE